MGDQLVKLGTSVDYCICKGSRKDGSPCSIVVNRYTLNFIFLGLEHLYLNNDANGYSVFLGLYHFYDNKV